MLTSLTLTASLAVPYLLLAQLPQRSAGRRVAATALNAWRTSVYELPDGRVLAVDSIKRLVLLDSNLSLLRVVVDSVPTRIRPPWPTTGFLIPYENGGVAYVDGVRPMFSQILGDSVIAANRPLPRTDLIPAIDHIGGRAAFDSSGRLVYAILRTAPPAYWRTGDSAYLAEIDSRRPPTGDPRMLPQKTITAVAELYHVDSAGRNRAILANDLWAVVGGTIVVLRADGRTIEKWSFDGVRLEVVKLPREPRVLSMAEKRHIVDSVRTMAEAYKARHPEEPVVHRRGGPVRASRYIAGVPRRSASRRSRGTALGHRASFSHKNGQHCGLGDRRTDRFRSHP